MTADGVDPTARDERGHTALTALCAAAAPEVAAREWRENCKAAEMGCSLGEALGLDEGLPAGGWVDTLHQVLALTDATPALLWTPDARGRLPLHWAVASGRIELVLLLTRAVRDLEAKDETTEEEMVLAERALTGVDDYGYSPLHAANAFAYIAESAASPSGKTGKSSGDSGEQPTAGVATGAAAAPPVDAAEGTVGGAGAGGRQQQQQQQQRRRRGGRDSRGGSATPQSLKYDKELLSYTRSYGFPGWVGTEGSAGRPDGARPRCKRAASATIYAIAGAMGLHAALSGAGALHQCGPRLRLYGYAGFDLVLRDARALLLGEDGGGVVAEDKRQHYGIMHYPSRGRRAPAERRARAGAAEHAANVCHDIAVVRRAAVASRSGGGNRRRGGRGGGGQDEANLNFWLYSLWRPTTRVRRGAGPGGRGLSDAALAFVVEQHLLDPAMDAFSVGTWASILGEALALALHAVDGDAAALVGAGGLYPSLAYNSPLWAKLLGGLGKLGRCLCFGLLGQREGAHGEVLTQREGALFENLLDEALRLLVPLGEGMAADAGVTAGDGAAAVRKLTDPYLLPVFRLMEDALGSMEGMVEEPTRFAVLTRAYLAWSMATCSSTVSQGSGPSYHKRVQAIVASCAPKLAAVPAPAPDGGGQGEEEMEAMVRAFRQFNKASALKTLAAAATVPTTSTGGDDATAPPPRRTRNKRGRPPAGGNAGLPFPEEFEAFVGRARPGLNRVLRGMPDALTGTLAMLLRLPGAVETASKLEHMVVQLERQADDSFTIYWNRFLPDQAEALEMVVSQISAADRQALARASLSVTLEGEPGIGDGPLRELLDALRPLFAPERPPAFNEPSSTSTSSSGGLLAPFLPLFRRLEHQGDADAVGPRPSPPFPPSRPLHTESGLTPRQEEKGGEATTAAAAESRSGGDSSDGSDSSSKPAIPIQSVEEKEALKEDKKGRLLLLRVAGRVLGFALRNGMPLGVIIPPTVCRALLDLDDPSVPKQQLELPPPPPPPVVTAAMGPGAVAVAAAAVNGEEEEEGKQQEEEEAERAAPAGGGGQGRTTTNSDNRRRRGRRSGKDAKGAAASEEKPPPPQQQQQAKQPPSPTGMRSVYVPVGRWRELVGEDDPVLLRSLEAMLAHDFDHAGPEDPLADTRFVVTEEEGEGEDGSGTMREVELVPGGARLRVSNNNKQTFVALVARRRLLRGAEGGELRALKSGLLDVIPPRFLALFSPRELSAVLSGPRGPIDFTELRRLVQYERGLTPHSPVVLMLWEVVAHELNREEQQCLLLFWSGSRTPPALGFAQRADDDFAWTVSKLTGPRVSPHSLPEASTCDRRLSLPEYKTAAQLLAKLRAAITHGCVGYDRV